MLASTAVLLGGCGSSGSPTSPSSAVEDQATAAAPASPAVTGPTGASQLSPAQVEMLAGAIQDEYHAEAVYQGVLGDLGPVFPFVNIVVAEGRHAASIALLFTSRGLTPPANAWNTSNVPHFPTLAAACGAAAEAEVANVALYDRYLATELPQDVRNVFTNNRAASVDKHLPAFSRCR